MKPRSWRPTSCVLARQPSWRGAWAPSTAMWSAATSRPTRVLATGRRERPYPRGEMEDELMQAPSLGPEHEASRLEDTLRRLEAARQEVRRVVVGQPEVIDQAFVALLAGGHVLIESPPGLGKTLLVRTLGAVLNLKLNRLQFTPDLMPADITGTYTLAPGDAGRGMSTVFQPGPVFAQMV